jgi:hypothetical protein
VAALREGAQTPTALAVYALLALGWMLLFARAQRLAGFAAAIRDLPELQRAELLKRAYPSFFGRGLTSLAYIQGQRRRALFAALLALLVAAAIIAIVALRSMTTAQAGS